MEATKLKKAILLNCMLLVSSLMFAHPLPSTKVNLKIKNELIYGIATMPVHELETATKRELDSNNLDLSFLREYFQKHIQASSPNQTWEVKINSIDSFKEDDGEQGGHHGVIEFLTIDFELSPSKGDLTEPFVFDFDAITHEVVTHDVEIFQISESNDALEKKKLGEITLNIQSGVFDPVEIKLDGPIQKTETIALKPVDESITDPKTISNKMLSYIGIGTFLVLGLFGIFRSRKK